MGIQNFWIQKFQQKQLSFNPPTVNTYSLQNPLNSTCGVQKNPNFIYCFLNNNIYLSEDLYKSMAKEFDLPSIEFAIAHEYGHAVQKQLDKIQTTSITREYQADCLAGVYMSRYNDKSIDKSVYSFLYEYTEHSSNFSSLFDPDSHGNSESRFKAFKTGFETRSINQCFDSYDLDGAVSGLLGALSELIFDDSKPEITGKWRIKETEIDFINDSLLTVNTNGMTLYGTYTIENDKLTMRFKGKTTVKEKIYQIVSLSKKQLVYTIKKENIVNSVGAILKSTNYSETYSLDRIP